MPAESISTERSRLGTWASHLVLDFFVGRSHRFLLTITYSNHLKALVNTRFDAFQPCDLLVADGRTQQILLRLSQQRCMLKDHEKTGGFCFWKYVLEISKKLGDKMNTRYLCIYTIYIYMRWYRIIYMNYLPTLGSLHITSHCFTSWVSAATPWASLAFFANSAVLFGNFLEEIAQKWRKKTVRHFLSNQLWSPRLSEFCNSPNWKTSDSSERFLYKFLFCTISEASRVIMSFTQIDACQLVQFFHRKFNYCFRKMQEVD